MADKRRFSGGAREQAERQVEEIKSFLEQWHTFLIMLRTAHHGREINREDEVEFLKLKSHLAQRHQYMMNWLERDYLRMEPITPFLQSCVTLRMIQNYEQGFYKKLEIDWHNVFVKLNMSLGRFRFLLGEEFA